MTYHEVQQEMLPIVEEMNRRLQARRGPRIAILGTLLRPVTESETAIVLMTIPNPDGGVLAEVRCHLLKQVTIPQLRLFLHDCEQKLLNQVIELELQSG